MLKTFRHFFGANWTQELETTWTEALQVVASVMIEGAKEFVPTATTPSPTPQTFAVPADSPLQGEIRTLARRILEEAVQREIAETLEQELKERLQQRMREIGRAHV